jgi:antitoxin component of MazEF toxin-antitoxin module
MSKVKIRKIGNSLGIILPAEMLQKLNMREKDDVLIVEDYEGAEGHAV